MNIVQRINIKHSFARQLSESLARLGYPSARIAAIVQEFEKTLNTTKLAPDVALNQVLFDLPDKHTEQVFAECTSNSSAKASFDKDIAQQVYQHLEQVKPVDKPVSAEVSRVKEIRNKITQGANHGFEYDCWTWRNGGAHHVYTERGQVARQNVKPDSRLNAYGSRYGHVRIDFK